ncbi:hypothetical protein AAMO2058_001633100, partial [Amorphochlora amoebiformis]
KEGKVKGEANGQKLKVLFLVLGTMYCLKKHYLFGLYLISCAHENLNEGIDSDTWHYIKCCLLSFIQFGLKTIGDGEKVNIRGLRPALNLVYKLLAAILEDVESLGPESVIITEALFLREAFGAFSKAVDDISGSQTSRLVIESES